MITSLYINLLIWWFTVNPCQSDFALNTKVLFMNPEGFDDRNVILTWGLFQLHELGGLLNVMQTLDPG